MFTRPPVTPALLRQIFDYEPATGKLIWKDRPREWFPDARSYATWRTNFLGKEALSCTEGAGYKRGIFWNQKLRAHRVVWAWVYGEWPDGTVDHVNHVRTDNRIENLRVVASVDNNRNHSRRRDNTSGRVGVHLHKPTGKWMARGGQNHLGMFSKFEDACARRETYERVHGYHRNHGT